jgi:pantoate--beta-alanine ligase
MRVVSALAEMRALAERTRAAGRRIAFVPTMGFLHAGHVSLLSEGRRRGDLLVLSIFVNPTQFGENEDLARYPRDLEADLEKARASAVDVAYVPEAAAVYPPGFQTFVEVRELARPLCGARRPGHFTGVATVVLKLFQTILPHVAVFGEKDWQQLQVVRRMVADLDLGVEIVGMPTVREADGLAMSSRNAYLSPDERRAALAIPRGLMAARERFDARERDAARLVDAAAAPMREAGLRVDYLELRDAGTLEELARADRPAVLAVAAFSGTTRLIDNVVLR